MNEPATNITIVGTETELRAVPTYKLLKEHLQKTYPSVMKIISAKNGELIRIENVKIIGYEVQQKETILDKIKKLQHKQKKAYNELYSRIK